MLGVLILLTKLQFGIGTGVCQDTSPIEKTYYVTIPANAEYVGVTTHYGLQLIGNSIVKQLGSWAGCGAETVQSCHLGTIATVGMEAKGASWGTTIPCGSGMYCIDQSKVYESGCGEERRSLTASVSSCSTPCAKTDELCKQLGGEWTDTGGCGTWTDPWAGRVLNAGEPCPFAAKWGKVNVAYECKRTYCNPPEGQTISYGCKPDPNYVAPVTPVPCSSIWTNFCNGNDLRKSDGCGQDNLIETCQYGCNAVSAVCNAAPVVAQCAWAGKKCVEGDVYQYDTVCNKQELVKTCTYGCLNGECNPVPAPTLTPVPVITPTSSPIPGFTAIPTPTAVIPTPLNPTGTESLNINVILLVGGGLLLAWLYLNQKT